jgi:hypothetical protein
MRTTIGEQNFLAPKGHRFSQRAVFPSNAPEQSQDQLSKNIASSRKTYRAGLSI